MTLNIFIGLDLVNTKYTNNPSNKIINPICNIKLNDIYLKFISLMEIIFNKTGINTKDAILNIITPIILNNKLV